MKARMMIPAMSGSLCTRRRKSARLMRSTRQAGDPARPLTRTARSVKRSSSPGELACDVRPKQTHRALVVALQDLYRPLQDDEEVAAVLAARKHLGVRRERFDPAVARDPRDHLLGQTTRV
ncbi:MAG: hypothetical protein ABI699_12595 [Caldimonas sp.]